MSFAVTQMPQRKVDSISVNSQDAKTPKDSQEKIITRDTCDSIITLPNNHRDDFAEPAVPARIRLNAATRDGFYVRIQPLCPDYEFHRRVAILWTPEDLSLSKNRGISAMHWADTCSRKCRLYNSEHPHGGCRFSEPSMLLSITGVQPRKLRVKDWQNAHGKVGIIDCQCHLRFKKLQEYQF